MRAHPNRGAKPGPDLGTDGLDIRPLTHPPSQDFKGCEEGHSALEGTEETANLCCTTYTCYNGISASTEKRQLWMLQPRPNPHFWCPAPAQSARHAVRQRRGTSPAHLPFSTFQNITLTTSTMVCYSLRTILLLLADILRNVSVCRRCWLYRDTSRDLVTSCFQPALQSTPQPPPCAPCPALTGLHCSGTSWGSPGTRSPISP